MEDGAGWLPILERCRDAALRAGSPAAARRKREVVEALDAHAALVPPELPARTLDTLRVAQARLEGVDVSGLLQRALDHVRAHPAIAECPVCQQGVEPTALAAELERRIASLEEIRAAKTAAHDLADRWRAFLDDVEELERVASSGDAAPETRLGGLALLEELDADRQALSPRIVARLQGLRTKLTDELGALGSVDRAPALARLCDGLEAAASDVLAIDVDRVDVERLQHLEDRLGDVVKALTAARKAVFEQQCAVVRDVFAQYYEHIHPPGDAAEVTRAPRLSVTNRAKGTAVFDGIFDGKSVGDPRHFYSEGHLDTVAICLFLALRRVRASRDAMDDPRFMVLDDVILSIDIGHAGRLVRLIADQFKDHQILVLSHNEYFMQLCRGPLHDAQRLDIGRWTYEGGPSIGRCLRNTERLRRTLDEGSTSEQIASDIRPVLDELLAVATEGFNVSVPARRSGHTVADLWNPLQKFLRREATRLELGDLSSVLARLDALQLIRNALGAHRNEWALQGDVGSVRELALALLELVERLECTTCRTIVQMRHPHDVAAGLACECGKNARPTLRRQIAAPQSVEGA